MWLGLSCCLFGWVLCGLSDWFCEIDVIVVFAVTFARFGGVFDVVLGCGWFSFGFGLFGFWRLTRSGWWLLVFMVTGCGVTSYWVLALCGLPFDAGCLLLYFAMCFVSAVRCCTSSLLVCCACMRLYFMVPLIVL